MLDPLDSLRELVSLIYSSISSSFETTQEASSMATSHQRHHENQDQDSPKGNPSQVVVVVVPFPAQSHLNQSHFISSHNIPVYYIGSVVHNSQVKSRSKHQHHDSKIHFHDIPIPSLVCPPPNPNAKTKFPEHLIPSFQATAHLRQPVSSLLHLLSSMTRRLVIIHDGLVASAVQDYRILSNAEAY